MQIKNIYGTVLFEDKSETIKECLQNAIKAKVDLSGSNLRGSDLSGSDLSWSNLSGSNLSGSNLSGSDHKDAKGASLVIAQTRILPGGDIIGWKKLRNETIAKLLIPASAKRSHAFGRKCRAECATVLEIWCNGEAVKTGASLHNSSFAYAVGATVKPVEPFSDNWQDECASGIHFYITREEAEAHE